MIRFLICPLLFAATLLSDISCAFSAPKGWKSINNETLPCNKTKTIGYIKQSFGLIRPSINLTYEKTDLSFEEYLKIVKDQRHSDSKISSLDLGWIETPVGKANVSKLNIKVPGGEIAMLQAIWHVNGVAFVMTGASSNEDFLKYSKDFLKAFKTLKIESLN